MASAQLVFLVNRGQARRGFRFLLSLLSPGKLKIFSKVVNLPSHQKTGDRILPTLSGYPGETYAMMTV